jgi:hypothetical protein
MDKSCPTWPLIRQAVVDVHNLAISNEYASVKADESVAQPIHKVFYQAHELIRSRLAQGYNDESWQPIGLVGDVRVITAM